MDSMWIQMDILVDLHVEIHDENPCRLFKSTWVIKILEDYSKSMWFLSNLRDWKIYVDPMKSTWILINPHGSQKIHMDSNQFTYFTNPSLLLLIFNI